MSKKKRPVEELSVAEIIEQGVFRLPLEEKRRAVEKATLEALKDPTPETLFNLYYVVHISGRPDCGLVWSEYKTAAGNVVGELD
jgi:hypothetical protein